MIISMISTNKPSGLFKYLLDCNKEEYISIIKEILELEEYDTDALEIDISFYQKYGDCNIVKLIRNDSIFALIFEFIHDNKCMSSVIFS